MKQYLLLTTLLLAPLAGAPVAMAETLPRKVVSLDGTWQIAEGTMNQTPTNFDRTVPVPGLASLATPAFNAPGPKVANRQSRPQKDPKRDAFWYRRTFVLDSPLPAVAKLKVAKAIIPT